MSLLANRAARQALCLWLVFVFAESPPLFAAKVLQWKFTPGEKSRYTIETSDTTEMKMKGQGLKMSQIEIFDLSWQTTAVDNDGLADITVVIDRVRSSVENQAGKASYDTDAGDKKPSDPVLSKLAPLLDLAVKQPITLKLKPSGEIVERKLPKELADKFARRREGGPMGVVMNESRIDQLLAQVARGLPSEAVEKGATWENANSYDLIGFYKRVETSKLEYKDAESVEGLPLEKIGVEQEITIDPDPKARMKVSVKDQEATGEIYFDAGHGRLHSSEISVALELKFSTPGQEVDATIDTRITTTLTPSEE